eukprot:2081509-Rhodomonas_salina.2
MILERTQQHPFLTSLDLRDNGIRSEGMTSISSMLRQVRSAARVGCEGVRVCGCEVARMCGYEGVRV